MRPRHLPLLLPLAACGARWEPLGWDTAGPDEPDPATVLVAVQPATPITGDTLTCAHAPVLDDAGAPLPVAYAWSIDGVDAGVDTDTLDGVFRGEAVRCAVLTDTDRWDADAVVVGNAPPGPPEVAFARTDLVPGARASCVVVADAPDPEGDALTYTWSWSAGGAELGTGETFDTSALSPGQLLTCVATPFDGADAGPPGFASLALGTPTTGERADTDAWLLLAGTTTGGAFGKAIDTVDDLDGDGLAELLVSAPNAAGAGRGAVYLFTSGGLSGGGERADTDADAWWIGHTTGDNLGGARGIAGIGDFDGDGLADLAAASILHDAGGNAAGAAYVLYGGDPWTPGGDIELDAPARFLGNADDWMGARMAGGDLDGDGLDDLAVSAPYNDLAINRGGAVAVYLGDAARYAGTFTLADADAIVTGAGAYDDLGWSLDVGGDADADGYTDLLVGSFHAWGNVGYRGVGAVLSGDELAGGRLSVHDAAFLLVHGEQGGDRFGYDVATAGDVDGDGVTDVLMGGYLSDTAGQDAGEARLFFGAAGTQRTAAASEADASLFGSAAGEQFGSALLSAGDFDGDGLADLLTSGPRSSSVATESGAALLYLGRHLADWSAGPSLRITGSAAGDWLGDELAALDANGDGYSDLVLGAQGADPGADGGGAVYVFVGP